MVSSKRRVQVFLDSRPVRVPGCARMGIEGRIDEVADKDGFFLNDHLGYVFGDISMLSDFNQFIGQVSEETRRFLRVA